MGENDGVLGFNSGFGIGLETEEGTPVDADMWFEAESNSWVEKTELHESDAVAHFVSGVVSVEDDSASAVPVKHDVGGGVAVIPRFAHLPRLLGLMFGGTCSGLEYTPAATQTSFTVETDKGAEIESGKSVEQHAGNKVSKLTLSSEQNKPLKIAVEGIGRSMTMIAGTAPDWSAWSSDPPMMHDGLTLVSGPDEIPSGGIYDIEVEISRDNEDDHYCNSTTRVAIPTGRLHASGKLTVPYNNTTAPMKTKIKAGTRFGLRPQWVGQDDETLDLVMSCKATGEPKEISDAGAQKLEIAFKCVRTGATHAIEAVLGS